MYFLFVVAALVITIPIAGLSAYRKENLPGLALCIALAVPAWYLGRIFPLAGGPILGIMLGIILANLGLPFPTNNFKAGIQISSKKALQVAIVLLGFQMNLLNVLALGTQALLLLLAVIAAALVTVHLTGRLIALRGNEQILIGVGTAICGGSAIAAASPIIKAKEDEVARAISVIFLFNVIAAFSFPVFGHLAGMTDLQFGMWAGSAINDTSSVVAASFAYSDEAGGIATVVKLTRTLMIIPFCLALSVLQNRKSKEASGKLQIGKTFPWFVAGFVIASIIRTMDFIPANIPAFWGQMGRFLIIVAMISIGLGCNIRELLQKGRKSILLGGCCSLAVALTALGIIHLLGLQ